MKRHPLADIAPYPRNQEEATAAAIIRHHTAFGLMHDRIGEHFPDGDQWRRSIASVVSSYTTVHLLTQIRDRLGVQVADEVARDLWTSWEDGALPPELWMWAKEEGLDRAAIQAAADRVAENIRAKAPATPAPTLGRHVAALVAWLDSTNPRTDHEIACRVMKVAGEAGEAVEAYLAAVGQNPRKKGTATLDHVRGELLDVAATALVAAASLEPGRAEYTIDADLLAHLAYLCDRVGAGGEDRA